MTERFMVGWRLHALVCCCLLLGASYLVREMRAGEPPDAWIKEADDPPMAEVLVEFERLPDLAAPRFYQCSVVKVVDGDTLDVQFNVWPDVILRKRLRLDNVDTFELTGAEKAKGLEAKQFLEERLKEAKVYIRTTGDTGKYGRTLARLYVADGDRLVDLGEVMKAKGLGR